jgi:protein-arginine kinase activator protein McsA
MAREISCENCHKHLGEIRDARLAKGIKHLCADCYASMKAYVAQYATLRQNRRAPDLGKIFGFE